MRVFRQSPAAWTGPPCAWSAGAKTEGVGGVTKDDGRNYKCTRTSACHLDPSRTALHKNQNLTLIPSGLSPQWEW